MLKIPTLELNKEQSIFAYEKMLLLRKFEEKCSQLYGMGLIGGFCHLYIGQEAVATGTYLAKKEGDYTITSYRDHAHVILSGCDPMYVLAELMGKATGCSKGKGGSMHMFNKDGRFYGGHGIVAAQTSIGTGLGFAAKYNASDDACITFLGDGAVNQGQFYESMNMAALWKLPVVYVIENNEYAMGTSTERSTAVTDLYKKGASFGIEGYQVDGMNIQKVYSAMSSALDFVRKSGPIILEFKTYRYRGHSMSDSASYRNKNEVEDYKTKDPIACLLSYILHHEFATENFIKEIEKTVKAKIKEIVDFSESSSEPQESELYDHIYS